MPDLTPLPPLPRPPSFRPDTGRFEHVASVARRRRAARGVPVGAALAAVLAFGAAGDRGATGGLDTVDPANGTNVSAVPSAPAGVDAPGRAARPGGPAPGGRVPGAAGETPEPTPSPEPDPVSLPVTPPPAREPGGTCESPYVPATPSHPEDDWSCTYEPPVTAVALSSVPFDPAAACEAYQMDDGDSQGWCLRSRNARTVASGGTLTLVLEICRPTSAGTLRFADAREVAVFGFLQDASPGTHGPDEMFGLGWSSDPSAGAHTLPVAAATCARWTGDWQANAATGDPLPPGDYEVVWSNPHDGTGLRPTPEWTLTVG